MAGNNEATGRFILVPIDPTIDYPTLTNISILAFLRNPFHYLTFPPAVAHDEIVAYHQATKVQSPFEGKEIQTIKIIDTSTPDRPIVALASWKFREVRNVREPARPVESDFGFVENYRKRMAPIVAKNYNPQTDIELLLMRTLPSYQKQGLGDMLLKWGIQQAEKMGKRIFLVASPEARTLYEKNGFVGVGEVRMDLQEWDPNGEGVYIQTAMIWDGGVKRGTK